MKSVIVQLWNGELCPVSRSGINNEEQQKLELLMRSAQAELEESLSEQQKELFEKYLSCQSMFLCAREDQAFVDGYSLGTRITAEAMLGADRMAEK